MPVHRFRIGKIGDKICAAARDQQMPVTGRNIRITGQQAFAVLRFLDADAA